MTKPEVEEFYVMFGSQLRQYMTDKDNITQSKLIDLVQDSIDITFTGSTDHNAKSSKTELRVHPAAYMAARPDHDDDGVDHTYIHLDEEDNLLSHIGEDNAIVCS